MKSFKRFKLVERVYESDYLTAQRVAKRFEAYWEHKDLCQTCRDAQNDKDKRCWRGKELFAKCAAATEKRYEEYEIQEQAGSGA